MAKVPIDLVGVVGHGYLEITDKLQESRFFLDMMADTTDWPRFRWLTSAFLNAARAAMDWLAFTAQYAIPDDEGGLEPDPAALKILDNYLMVSVQKKSGKVYVAPRDPLLKQLADHRTVTAHEGPLWIQPEKVSSPKEFRFYFGKEPVLEFASRVLERLEHIEREVTS